MLYFFKSSSTYKIWTFWQKNTEPFAKTECFHAPRRVSFSESYFLSARTDPWLSLIEDSLRCKYRHSKRRTSIGNFKIKNVTLVAVEYGLFMSLVATGASHLAKMRVMWIRIHILTQCHQVLITSMAFEALLRSEALLGEEPTMAIPTGDAALCVQMIQMIRSGP